MINFSSNETEIGNQNIAEFERPSSYIMVHEGLESGVLSLHNNMKTLEEKYIDLANYYKLELIKKGSNNGVSDFQIQSTVQNQKGSQDDFTYQVDSLFPQNHLPSSIMNAQRKTPNNSRSKVIINSLPVFDEFKEGIPKQNERSIIQSVKVQRKKLENEMRNLISVYSQQKINNELPTSAIQGQMDQLDFYRSLQFTSGASFKDSRKRIVKILKKYQNQLLLNSEYKDSFEKDIQITFGEMQEELSDLFQIPLPSHTQSSYQMVPFSPRLAKNSLIEQIEKLSRDYDIQQEYALSNTKEIIFQVQHANDQFQLDIKKISLDFYQIEKEIFDQQRGLIKQLQSLPIELQNNINIEHFVKTVDQVSSGLQSFAQRVFQNEQKLSALQENHSESVQNLRNYREKFSLIFNEFSMQLPPTLSQKNCSNFNDIGGHNIDMEYSQIKKSSQETLKAKSNEDVEEIEAPRQESTGQQNLTELQSRIEILNNQNASLNNTITEMRNEMLFKQTQLSERNQQNKDLKKKFKQSIKNNFWRQQCQKLTEILQKFLQQMQRLQRANHHKEPTLQHDKQQFEIAKKEMELKIQEAMRYLKDDHLTQLSEESEVSSDKDQQLQAVSASASTSAIPFLAMISTSSQRGQKERAINSQAQSVSQIEPGMVYQLHSGSEEPVILSVNTTKHNQHIQKKRFSEKLISASPNILHSDMQTQHDQVNQELQSKKNEHTQKQEILHLQGNSPGSQQANQPQQHVKQLHKDKLQVQDLLQDIKNSQENIQKAQLQTEMTQQAEKIESLESSIKQLKEKIAQHETHEKNNKQTINELRKSLQELKVHNRHLKKSLKKSSFTQNIRTDLSKQMDEIESGQISWFKSVEKHLKNKEKQIEMMTDAVNHVRNLVQEKNGRIQIQNDQILTLNQLLESNQQLTMQTEVRVKQQERQLLGEVQQLKDNLKTKQNGSRMIGAIMRAFKQKLQDEIRKNQTSSQEKASQLKKFTKVVNERDTQIYSLSAKVEKKSFKCTQQKKVLAQANKDLDQLHQKYVSGEQERHSLTRAVGLFERENDQLKSTLKIKRTGNVMLNALMRAFRQKLIEEKQRLEQVKHSDNLKIQQLNSQLTETKKVISGQIERDDLIRSCESLKTQLAAEKQKYGSLRDEHNKLNDLLEETKGTLQLRIKHFKQLEQNKQTLEKQNQAYIDQLNTLQQAQESHLAQKQSIENQLKTELNQKLTELGSQVEECGQLRKQIAILEETNRKNVVELQNALRPRPQTNACQQTESTGQVEKDTKFEQLKSKLYQNEQLIVKKNEEIQNLRDKLELTIREASQTESTSLEMEEEIIFLKNEVKIKSDDLRKVQQLLEVSSKQNKNISNQKTELEELISQLKKEFADKNQEMKTAMERQSKEIDQKASILANQFEYEKKQLKAKIQSMLQQFAPLGLKQDQVKHNNYESSDFDNEVELPKRFEELGKALQSYKETQEARIQELSIDRQQLESKYNEQSKNLTTLKEAHDELKAKLKAASADSEDKKVQLEAALNIVTKNKEKMTDNNQQIAQLEDQIAQLVQQLAEAQLAKPDRSEMSSMHQDSYLALQKENLQLLEKLQRTENKLQKARNNESSEIEATPKQMTLSPEVLAKLDTIDQRMTKLKRELHSAKSTCLKELLDKFSEQLKTAQKTFIDNELLSNAINSDKVTGWNNQVKECKKISYKGKQFYMVQDVSAQPNFYLVDLDRVTQIAADYLKNFVNDYDDEEFVTQNVLGQSLHELSQEGQSSAIDQLMALITDLRQDRKELQAELELFREGGSNLQGESSKIINLKDEEMKDDIEYLTGENKELHLKVKDVCLLKASLQMELAQARKRIKVLEERDLFCGLDEGHGGVNEANNTGIEEEMLQLIEVSNFVPNDHNRDQDFESQNDSVEEVISKMEKQSTLGNTGEFEILKLKLMHSEQQCSELKAQLSELQGQINIMIEEKNKSDEDSGQSLIPHIKVTLIQYMRNVAMTDKQNEDLLMIIFNMMEFTDQEIQELKMARINLKMIKGKPARAVSTSLPGNNSNSMSKEDDGQAKQKKGFFGMFGKKQKDQNLSGGGQSNSYGQQLNLRPVPRR